MGIEEIETEYINQSKVKKRYLIREILPKRKVGFQFLSGRRNQENEVPKLFVSNQDNTVELTPKEYKGERDEISRITNFVTFLILFFTLPQILELIPFAGDVLAFLAKLVIFVIIIRDVDTFSKKIAELLILPFQRNKAQRNPKIVDSERFRAGVTGLSLGRFESGITGLGTVEGVMGARVIESTPSKD